MANKERSNIDDRTNEAQQGDNRERENEKIDRNAAQGRGWHGDPEGHAQAGRKGGLKVSQDREHMARIGRKGGEEVSKNREHMSRIGRKGGSKRG